MCQVGFEPMTSVKADISFGLTHSRNWLENGTCTYQSKFDKESYDKSFLCV